MTVMPTHSALSDELKAIIDLKILKQTFELVNFLMECKFKDGDAIKEVD
jgi:hypothetical protein